MQLQTVSAERSGVVTGRQMVDIALNGRNLTGLLKTVAGGNADTNNFNGQRTDQMNFTVDGQVVIDSGVNALTVQRINVDAITEFKVSSNSMGAEFGRNSGAQVQVVTKSGGRDFHGAGYWFKRGEFMNANTFVNNATGVPRQIYRYMTLGYNVGGPIYIPGKFNRDKEKLFFFASAGVEPGENSRRAQTDHRPDRGAAAGRLLQYTRWIRSSCNQSAIP